MILYSYPISPYSRKVAAILRYQERPFEERHVHPLKRGEIRKLTGQTAIPVLLDGPKALWDSTRIAQYLNEKTPDRPVYPVDPAQRSLALLLEDWADEALAQIVMPALYFIPYNAKRIFARLRAGYPPGKLDDVAFAAVRNVVSAAAIRKYGRPYGWKWHPSVVLNRLADACDALEGTIGPSGWLVGEHPTAADFAVWGFLEQMENLDGWETVRARKKLLTLIRRVTGQGATAVLAPSELQPERDGEALIDAKKLRARKKVVA